jgi:hypothetical protein
MENKFDIHSLEGQRDEIKAKNTIYGPGWSAAIAAKLFTDGLPFTGENQFSKWEPRVNSLKVRPQEVTERCRDLAEEGVRNR